MFVCMLVYNHDGSPYSSPGPKSRIPGIIIKGITNYVTDVKSQEADDSKQVHKSKLRSCCFV